MEARFTMSHDFTRKVQVTSLGSHLVSVPQAVIGRMSGKPLQATWEWSTRVGKWVVTLKERPAEER